MSSKGLTANFNRSFEWLISHRKRPVILSVVRAVAQLTRRSGGHFSETRLETNSVKLPAVSAQIFHDFPVPSGGGGLWRKRKEK